jgi:hypothetical protein
MKYIISITIFSLTIILGCKKNEENKKTTSKEISGNWIDTAYNRYFLRKLNYHDTLINEIITETKFHYYENYNVEFNSSGIIFPLGIYKIVEDSIFIQNKTNDSIIFRFKVNNTYTLMKGTINDYGTINLLKE